MAVFDFKDAQLPKWNEGIPWGRGMLHWLVYSMLDDVVVGENIDVIGKVPADEHWYVLQWQVHDQTAPGNVPNGWKAQALYLQLSGWFIDVAAPPTPIGGATNGTPVWQRWWDGVNYINWDQQATVGIANVSRLIVRCTDPVWSVCRWPAGTIFRIRSTWAETASAGVKGYSPRLTVLRFRLVDYDFKRLLQEDGVEFLFKDLHMQQHRPVLGQ